MKLLLNRKPIDGPWGGGNLLFRAICENAEANGFEIVHQLEPGIDAILMVDPHADELRIGVNEIYNYTKNHKVPVIHRVNECDARKGTNDVDRVLRACSHFAAATVFVSDWMKDYHTQHRDWHCREHRVIYNGVDHQHFKPGEKIDDGKVNIVAHHWSNNYLKGFDIYDKLDEWVGEQDDFTFTYIGRERGTFKNTTVIAPLHGQALGDKLGRYDVYVSASRFDPGPNHVIEALACGLPTFAFRDGGGACEFVGMDGVYANFEELVLDLECERDLRHPDVAPVERVFEWPHTWEDCARQYFDVIKKTLEHTGGS